MGVVMDDNIKTLDHLDTVLEHVIRHLALLAETQVEFEFLFDGGQPNDDETDQATAYKSLCYGLGGLGDFVLSDDGIITDKPNPQNPRSCITTITTPTKVHLPQVIHNVCLTDVSSREAWGEQYNIGFMAVFQLEHAYQLSACAPFGSALKRLNLDELTKARLSSHATRIVNELDRFIPWLELAVYFTHQDIDENDREKLADDAKLILQYIAAGNELNTKHMRALCIIANSLQPVLSLITKNTPELTA